MMLYRAFTSLLLIISFNGNLVVPEEIMLYDLTDFTPLEVTSLGRVASLGEFYDVRNDKFKHFNLFEKAPPNSSLKLTENKDTKLKYTLLNSLKEKFQTLDVSAELQLSVLGGLIELKGSGHFFKDTKTSAKSAKASLVQSFSTVYEQVSILDSALKSEINRDALENMDATHVVVGIQWGGNFFVSVEDLNEDNEDIQKVEGSLGATMKMLFGTISGEASVNITESEKKKLSQFSFEIFGDLVPETVPQTIYDALEFMKNSPKLVIGSNNNKGKAIKYYLVPVDALKKLWDFEMKISSIVRQIDMTTIQNCVKLFDDLQTVQRELNDVNDLAKQYRNYISSTKNEMVNELKDKFDIFYSEVTLNLSQHLVKVRTGSENISALHDVLLDATSFKKEWQKDNQKVLSPMKEEIMTLNYLQKQNISLFDKQRSFSRMLWENQDKDLYIYFFNYDANILYDKSIRNLKKVVDNKNKNKLDDLIFAVDYDLIEGDKAISGWNRTNKICVFKNGDLIFDNYPDGNRDDNHNPDSDIWSIQQIQAKMQQFEKQLVPVKDEVQRLGKQIVSIGFIYVQYPNEQKPEDIWPGTKWENVSPKYAGLFFRAEGGQSNTFETVQGSSYPVYRVDQYENLRKNGHPDKCYGTPCSMPLNGWSDWIFSGGSGGGDHFIRHHVESIDREVRPTNQAIRIWKRIQ